MLTAASAAGRAVNTRNSAAVAIDVALASIQCRDRDDTTHHRPAAAATGARTTPNTTSTHVADGGQPSFPVTRRTTTPGGLFPTAAPPAMRAAPHTTTTTATNAKTASKNTHSPAPLPGSARRFGRRAITAHRPQARSLPRES